MIRKSVIIANLFIAGNSFPLTQTAKQKKSTKIFTLLNDRSHAPGGIWVAEESGPSKRVAESERAASVGITEQVKSNGKIDPVNPRNCGQINSVFVQFF